MKKNKQIEQFFKDSLGSFEATPSPEVWSKIEAELKKEKEDRKIIPLWWKLGGIAALLALMFSLGTFLFTENKSHNPIVVTPPETIEQKNTSITNKEEQLEEKKSPIDNPSQITQETIVALEIDETQKTISGKEGGSNTKLKSAVRSVTTSNPSEKNSISLNSSLINKTKTSTAIVSEEIKEDEKQPLIDTSNKIIPQHNNQNAIVSEKKGVEKAIDKTSEKNNTIREPSLKPNTEKVAVKTTNSKTETKEVTPEKKSIFEAIEEEKETAIVKEDKTTNGYWEVSPNVGPVYYNSLNGGSSIDPSFADNSQSGDVNISYGVQVSYAINNKLSIRTGVNNINLGYSTGGIEIASGPEAFGLGSVAYENPGRNVITAFDRGTVAINQSTPGDPFGQIDLKSSTPQAELQQNISYFEIPMEAKYSLVNKRIGINMIGGFSTLLLGTNEISAVDGNSRNFLGEANNLNNLSFSTNVGLGFDYKFSKKLKFNIEPMFKYQLNPYSDTSVNFRPYFFGVFSGFSFKF